MMNSKGKFEGTPAEGTYTSQSDKEHFRLFIVVEEENWKTASVIPREYVSSVSADQNTSGTYSIVIVLFEYNQMVSSIFM